MGMDYNPQCFEQFVGQEKAKSVLDVLCRSARKRGTAVAHTLLSGPPGLGKTTLARIVAKEMGARIIELVGGNIQCPEQLTAQLAGLQRNDILFLDEIHALNRSAEETLYSAMQDKRITIVQNNYDDLMKCLGMTRPKPTVMTLELPDWTLIGASTLSGLVSAPLRSRFVQVLTLTPYTNDDLTQILLNAASAQSFSLADSTAMLIARRSRSCARDAIQNLRWLMEYCNANDTPLTEEVLENAFSLKDIDRHGLTKLDRDYLGLLASSHRPVGVSTLAMALGESEETVERAIEPYLFQQGYIAKGTRGRTATEKGLAVVKGRRRKARVA